MLGRHLRHQRGLRRPLLHSLLAHRILWSRLRPDDLTQSKKHEGPFGEKERKKNMSVMEKNEKEKKKGVAFMKNVCHVWQEKQIILKKKYNT